MSWFLFQENMGTKRKAKEETKGKSTPHQRLSSPSIVPIKEQVQIPFVVHRHTHTHTPHVGEGHPRQLVLSRLTESPYEILLPSQDAGL